MDITRIDLMIAQSNCKRASPFSKRWSAADRGDSIFAGLVESDGASLPLSTVCAARDGQGS